MRWRSARMLATRPDLRSRSGTLIAFAAFCGLFVLTCLVYGSGRCGFLRSDDLTWIRAVEYRPFPAMCSEQFRKGSPNDYRPLTSVALWTEANIFGDAAAPYYAVNFALHAANALLVIWLALRFGLPRVWAVLAGLVFLLNPAPFRTIVWVSDIATILQMTFTLAAVHLWLSYLNRHSALTYFAVVLCVIASMFTKESGVMAAVLLPCADLLLMPDTRGRRQLWMYLPLAGAVAIYLALSLQPMPGWREYPEVYHFSWRMIPHAIYTIGFALAPIAVVPLAVSIGALFLLVTTVAAHNSRVGAFLAAWMVLAALPTAPFAPGGFETTGRYTYSLLAAASIAVGILFARASEVRGRLVPAVAGACTVVLLMAFVTRGLARRPYTVRPGVILYHYAVMSLMGYPRAEAFLTSEFPCSPDQVRAAHRWSEEFITDRGGRNEFLLPGLLVKGITDALDGRVNAADPEFQRATALAARSRVELVRGAPVVPERVRLLNVRWRSQPTCKSRPAGPVQRANTLPTY